MQLSVCIQDPTFTGTTYLYEAIIAAAARASNWRGLYAFASRDGVDHLIEDKVVHDLMNGGGEIDLVVGIDAVTNRATLERMQELERRHRNFRPKVFWNESRGLFHPKVSDFAHSDGGRTLIVGSGNLTPGGLMANFEAYTIITADQADEIDLGALEEFLERHAPGIRSIDAEALERAAKNIIRPIKGARQAGGVRVRRRAAAARPGPAAGAAPEAVFDRILLAQVPGAGGRWAQVHFNADVIVGYFRLTDFEIQRVYLTRVLGDGTREEVEVRRCVYSAGSNRNHKIEIGAAKGLAYPDEDRPLLIFRERQLRSYDYMLLMPGDEGYDRLIDLSNRLPSPGRGFPRPITDLVTLRAAWPDCPLLQEPDAEEQEI
jgi:hypothetical protein